MSGSNVGLGNLSQNFYTILGVLGTFSLNLNITTAQVLLTLPSDLRGVPLLIVLRDSSLDLTAATAVLTIKVGTDTYATISLGLTPIVNSQIALILPSTLNAVNDYSNDMDNFVPKVIPASGTITGTLNGAIGVGTLKIDVIGYMVT